MLAPTLSLSLSQSLSRFRSRSRTLASALSLPQRSRTLPCAHGRALASAHARDRARALAFSFASAFAFVSQRQTGIRSVAMQAIHCYGLTLHLHHGATLTPHLLCTPPTIFFHVFASHLTSSTAQRTGTWTCRTDTAISHRNQQGDNRLLFLVRSLDLLRDPSPSETIAEIPFAPRPLVAASCPPCPSQRNYMSAPPPPQTYESAPRFVCASESSSLPSPSHLQRRRGLLLLLLRVGARFSRTSRYLDLPVSLRRRRRRHGRIWRADAASFASDSKSARVSVV